VHDAILWARTRHDRVFHLAGSVSRGDSLAYFKAGFPTRTHPVCSWRLISDAVAYEELIDDWRVRHGREPDRPTGYFPAYRDPGDTEPDA
jgi:hypothetical protein